MHSPATIQHRFRCHDHGHRDVLHSNEFLNDYAVLMHVVSNAKCERMGQREKTEEEMRNEKRRRKLKKKKLQSIRASPVYAKAIIINRVIVFFVCLCVSEGYDSIISNI